MPATDAELAALRANPHVQAAYVEADGAFGDEPVSIWVELVPAMWSPEMECGTIHEPTMALVLDKLRGVEPRP